MLGNRSPTAQHCTRESRRTGEEEMSFIKCVPDAGCNAPPEDVHFAAMTCLFQKNLPSRLPGCWVPSIAAWPQAVRQHPATTAMPTTQHSKNHRIISPGKDWK